MNPLTNVKNINKLNEIELEKGLVDKKSWHDIYKDSAWIFIGGLAYGLTEGDILAVFSQYGEIVNVNLVRDKKTGKTKGFCFLCYANQKSTVLAVDNLNGIKLCSRTIRVDHVANYKPPKENENDDEVTKHLKEEGCAPKPIKLEPSSDSEAEVPVSVKKKKVKKEKKKHKKKKKSENKERQLKKVKVQKEKHDPEYDKYEYPERFAKKKANVKESSSDDEESSTTDSEKSTAEASNHNQNVSYAEKKSERSKYVEEDTRHNHSRKKTDKDRRDEYDYHRSRNDDEYPIGNDKHRGKRTVSNVAASDRHAYYSTNSKESSNYSDRKTGSRNCSSPLDKFSPKKRSYCGKYNDDAQKSNSPRHQRHDSSSDDQKSSDRRKKDTKNNPADSSSADEASGDAKSRPKQRDSHSDHYRRDGEFRRRDHRDEPIRNSDHRRKRSYSRDRQNDKSGSDANHERRKEYYSEGFRRRSNSVERPRKHHKSSYKEDYRSNRKER